MSRVSGIGAEYTEGNVQDAQEIMQTEATLIAPTYVRADVVFTHGEGCTVYDTTGKAYLDFAAGIAVNALGHAHPAWVAAVQEQAGRLTHMCNLFHTVPQVELAQRLTANSFAARVLFANSGSEANEAALKLARKYAWQKEQAGALSRPEIVAFSNGFHGRTMGALSATYKNQYRAPFEPLVPGVRFEPFNDAEAIRAAVSERTCAVIVEPVQGEGGVRPATNAFLEALREACNEHDALLIFDEVQCGLGRTGYLWAHERFGVAPDLMTLAKPLAGGLPIGALLIAEPFGEVLRPGDHGSTFAAGPLVCTAANVVFDEICRPEFLARVRDLGAYLVERLTALRSPAISEVRGAGLLVGVELDRPVAPLIRAARDKGLLLINSGENVLRLCPPLIISREQIDEAVAVLEELLHDW